MSRSHAQHSHRQPNKQRALHDSQHARPVRSARKPAAPAAASSTPSLTRISPVGQSLSSFVLAVPSPPAAEQSVQSDQSASSSSSHSFDYLSLPVPFRPFQRPFSSLQRGLYHQPPWPLHRASIDSSQPQREEEQDEGDAASFFVAPHSDLPYIPSSPFQLVALPSADPPPALSPSIRGSARIAPQLQPSIRLPLSRTTLSFVTGASPSVPASSSNVLLALTLREADQDWSVLVFVTAASTLSLLTLPASALSSASSSASSLSASESGALCADLLHLASPLWHSAAADSPILHLQCCDSPLQPVYTSLRSLPLLVAHSEQQATVYCVTRRFAASASLPFPLLRLTAMDTLRPFTSPLLCVAANHRLCSPTAGQMAAVDAGGCVYVWSIDARTRIGEQHSWQTDHDSDEDEEEPRELAESGAALDSRQVSLILRSSYDEPSRLSSLSSLSFGRCLFAPHPRSILVALANTVFLLSLRSERRSDGLSDLNVHSRVLQLPVMSAASVPVNRNRQAPNRPQPIRDYFFSYQLYRAGQRAQQQRNIKAEPPPEHNENKEEKEDEHSRGDARPAVSRKPAQSVESGELLDVACVPDFPFVLAVLSSSYVQLIDIRHSEQPMVEWQHEQRYSTSQRPHLLVYTANVGSDQRAGRHVLLLTYESAECAVLLYHCVLGVASVVSSGVSSALTSRSSVTPSLHFASMRLPSFGNISAPSSSAFQLLPFAPQPLIGLCALLTPIETEGRAEPSLPSLSLLHLSRNGAVIMQQWTAAGTATLESAVDYGGGEEIDVAASPRLVRAVLSSVCGVLFPSDECAPASLRSSAVRRHDVLDLSAGMHALLHGRHSVQQRQRSAVQSSSSLSSAAVSDALHRHVTELQHVMRSPRSAAEIAHYITQSQWIATAAAAATDGQMAWHRLVAQCVYGVLYGWVRRTQQRQPGQHSPSLPPLPVFHFHPQLHSSAPRAIHDGLQPLHDDAPFSLHRCRCEETWLGTTATQQASQCCPPQCCQSPLCLLADCVMFHCTAAVLPSLTFQAADDSELPHSDESRGRPPSQQRMDLSQDVGTLMQLMAQRPTTDAPAPSPYEQSSGSSPPINARACDELLASIGRQWQRWQQRAMDGPTDEQRAVDEVDDLDSGWQGLQTAGKAASSAERNGEVEDLHGWQELADDTMDEDDDD